MTKENKKIDNPYAFSRPIGERKKKGGTEYCASQKGMTLLDYFAAQTLIGYLSSFRWGEIPTEKTLAKHSYLQAKAMLKERENHIK